MIRNTTTAPRQEGFDYTVDELAAAVRVHPMTITKLVSTGAIRTYRIGRARRIPREEGDRIRCEGLLGTPDPEDMVPT